MKTDMIELININKSEPSTTAGAMQDLQLISSFFISSRSTQPFLIKNNNDMITPHVCTAIFIFSKKFFFCSHSIIVRKIEQVGYFYILQKIVYAFTEHNLQKREK